MGMLLQNRARTASWGVVLSVATKAIQTLRAIIQSRAIMKMMYLKMMFLIMKMIVGVMAPR